ncbi:regucalcin-like [Anneissia japonica]|uniref:regucalcin-like n=1 Tax=Anneissia japonica TaxID=1529436 RepID=UPI00142597F7|nr:regucalcin-like [Anneissia japonica]
MAVEVVVRNCGKLLEGPHWDSASDTLLFVDISGRAVHRYDPNTGKNKTVQLGENVGAVVPTKDGRLLIAGRHTFSYLDWESGKLEPIAAVEPDKPNNRFNDGKCDPMGRFWAGTMGPEERPAEVLLHQGTLYCLHTDLTVKPHFDQISISNGMAWSLDHKTLYYIDTLLEYVDALDYDKETGEIKNRRHIIHAPVEEGLLDGMCIDAEGMLWIAMFQKSRVNRYNPNTGEKLQTIMFPATNITSCCFGGPNYDVLYVTASAEGLTDGELKEQPLAGSVFKVTGLGVRGLPANVFG